MSWITKSLGLVTECTNCGTDKNLNQCPHCNAVICQTCLDQIVNRENWPEWFCGKKISSRDDLVAHIQTYLQKLKLKGGQAHCCKEFVNFRWKGIAKAMRSAQQRDSRITEFILR